MTGEAITGFPVNRTEWPSPGAQHFSSAAVWFRIRLPVIKAHCTFSSYWRSLLSICLLCCSFVCNCTSAWNMFHYCATTILRACCVHSCPQDNNLVNITECDLQVSIGPFNSGPGRLATQLTNPLPGFELLLTLPRFSVSQLVWPPRKYSLQMIWLWSLQDSRMVKSGRCLYRAMHP